VFSKSTETVAEEVDVANPVDDSTKQSAQTDVIIYSTEQFVAGPPLLNGRCTSLLRVVVSEMTYTVSSGTLNSAVP